MNFLAKSLEASSCAAARTGPNIFSPASWNASTMPAASGASGPTTVSRICSFLQKSISCEKSVSGKFFRPFSVAVPPLPGATNTFCTFALCASFHAMACSRPPEPMTRIFMSVAEVPHAREHHGDAALVGRGDHFCVAHAATGLDDSRGAGVNHRIQAVAERKVGVRGHYRAGNREPGMLRLDRRNPRAVNAAHLPRGHPDGGAVAAEHDGIGFDVLRHLPGEK